MKRAIVIVVALGLAMPTVAGAGSNLAGRTQSAAGKRISFYAGLAAAINDPLGKQVPVVRPRVVLLRYDGSIVVKGLRWASWGGSVARATGVYSASNCNPSCATGHRTNEAARVTLSSPGRVLGHEVYRCFQLTVPSDASIDGRSCIKREGKLYIYVAVKAAPKPSPAGADFYSLPGWACGMNRQEAKCEFFGPPPPGGTVSLSPSGQLALCNIPNTVPATPCDIGNPGLGTPTLKPGQQVTIQPFRCSFATSGLTLTCVVIKTGKGFVISGQSATPVG